MKSGELSEAFDCFLQMPVTINTTMESETDKGIGIMTFQGILIDTDDFMVYLGYNEKEVTTAIKWENIVTIELFDLNSALAEELNSREPGSESKN